MSKKCGASYSRGFYSQRNGWSVFIFTTWFASNQKIENIIREEMNIIGGQEITMTALQNPELWEKLIDGTMGK